jgi:D-sedoheptulose 7-phosphate isomerase
MYSVNQIITHNLNESSRILNEFLSTPASISSIENAALLMIQALEKGKKIIACGNGGSMSDAMHFAEELTGRFRQNRISIPAIAISDPSFLTCAANDFGYEHVFSRFIEGMGNPGDVLLAISTSGNSSNILNAVAAAKEKQMLCIALTGKSGGKLSPLCDAAVIAPNAEWADRIQEIHIKVIHCFIDCIEQKLNLVP